jgi:hypothetical protein
MKLTSIASEVWRNTVSGTGRVPLLASLVAITAGLAAAADVATVHAIQNDARAYISAGASTHYIMAENSIAAAPCEALNEYENVNASGALRESTDVVLDSLGAAPFQAYEVSPGFGDLLNVAPGHGGVWISSIFADSLGVDVGATLKSEGRDLRIGGVFDYPEDGRDSRLSYAFVVPTTTRESAFDECWTRSWPESAETEGQLRSTLTYEANSGTEVSQSQLNRSFGTKFDGGDRFSERPTRWAPLVAVIVAFLVGFASVRLRRLEYASALHAGQSRAALILTTLLETLIWAVLGSALAGAIIYLAAGHLAPLDMGWTPRLTLLPLLSVGAGAPLGALVGALLVRESDLFRYFKAR